MPVDTPDMEQRALIREFRLSEPGHGISCDATGAFIGHLPLLKRSTASSTDLWEPCDPDELSRLVSADFGIPIDLSSRRGGLKAIAKALNEGDLPRAQIATLLLAIPDPPLAKAAAPHDEIIRLIRDLCWSGLLKLDDAKPRASSPSKAISSVTIRSW